MSFDWISFLTSYNIEYVTDSNGVKIRYCPFCKHDGREYHLSVSTKGKGWKCWRNESTYKGISPINLIIELINCSYNEAKRIVGSEEVGFVSTEESFLIDSLSRLGLYTKSSENMKAKKLDLLPEFMPIIDRSIIYKLAWPYLENRGYDYDSIKYIVSRYGLMFTVKGYFAYRIIIPIYYNNLLVTWTARTIVEGEELRYSTLSDNYDKAVSLNLPQAVLNIKSCLFDYDELRYGGNTLVITEGPFDAIRISFLGEKLGIKATCLFNKDASNDQLSLLRGIIPKFARTVALFDTDAGMRAFSVFPEDIGIELTKLPMGYKDPAELDYEGFRRIFG